MHTFFLSFPKNVINVFSLRNSKWHVLAICLTYLIVVSGFDWQYFLATRNPILVTAMFPAVILGGILPILVPIFLLILGYFKKNKKIKLTAWAIGQAALIGSFVAAVYKAFTGRIHPSLYDTGLDISHQFQFGFLRGGIFWGWPSSHTTVAFAMAFALITLFPRQKILSAITFLYALYVGVGISMTIHWFSEFIAGAIFGIVVGVVVGKCFRKNCIPSTTVL